ncbi:MAG: transglycosylase domain-containing protein, partial [Anaerolineae bacterium]|nr:transglycosylase domain-containing protein [Anaerolineae bacterium]
MGSPILRGRLRRRNDGQNNGNRTLWLQLLVAALVFLATTVGAVATVSALALLGAYHHFAKDLPSPEQVEELTLTSFETTKIYDRTGQHLLYEVQDPKGGDRTIVPLRDIPMHMRNATIAVEDKTFYSNPAGINVGGIVRAAWNNIRGMPIQGGSSIAAQLVRNVTMTPEERYSITYERKIKEAILCYELTRRYPGPEGRDRILEWYLNTVYYGNRAYGVEAAAEVYFGKHARDLTLAEAALLAAIPQYPAQNPIDNLEKAKVRRAIVLDAMVGEGYITPEEAEEAKQAEYTRPEVPEELQIEAPHFVMHLLKVMEGRYGKQAVYGGGLRVITSLDYDLQKVEEIVRRHVKSWPRGYNARNAAAVVIRPSTGEILAMVGSVDYFDKSIDGEVNMAVEPRQPGSSFKPYTYAAAFEQGYFPGTMVEDKRTAFPVPGAAPYVPVNADGGYHGQMPLRKALACSYNVPAVILLDRIGIDSALEMAHRLGVNDLRDRGRYGLALTLGGGEISLLDHTYAFSVFANGGLMAGMPVPPQAREPGFRELDPVCILRVTDVRGRVVEEYLEPTVKRVLSAQVSYLVTSTLSDNNARTQVFGPHSKLVLSRPAAAKTGTTTDFCDGWTMGYNPQVSVGVWIGNSNRRPMAGMWGVTGASPIWHDIMETCFKSLPPVDFVMPPGMKWVEVDPASGATPGKARVRELYIDGWEPASNHKERRTFASRPEARQMA